MAVMTWFMRGGGEKGGGVSVPKKKCFTIIIHIGSFIIKNHAVQIDQLKHLFSFKYNQSIKKIHASPVSIVLLSFSIQTASGIVFFT